MDGSGNGYLKTVCDYVHLNPARAKLVSAGQPLKAFGWSSWPACLQAPSRRPRWVRVDRLLGEYRVPKDSAAGRRRLEGELEARRGAEHSEAYQPIRRGWFLGGKELREELLAAVRSVAGAGHCGEELRESAQQKADRLIAQALARKGWTERELELRPKGDPFKVRLARRLRDQTTVTVAWIAGRLRMGTRGHVTHLLYWHERQRPKVR